MFLVQLTITERDAKTLEVNFSTLQKEGTPCIGDGRRRAGPTIIKRILITPTAATELKVIPAALSARWQSAALTITDNVHNLKAG